MGQYEDCSLGDSTSDNSEKLIQGGTDNIYVILVKGEYMESQQMKEILQVMVVPDHLTLIYQRENHIQVKKQQLELDMEQ